LKLFAGICNPSLLSSESLLTVILDLPNLPVHVSISPDGAHAYVTNAGSNSVSVIDIGTNAVSATVPVGVHPVNAAAF
jgi:YVTN family beta-propeller protein